MQEGILDCSLVSGKFMFFFSLVKKSWFGSLTSGMGADRDDVQCVPVEDKSLNEIKAELIRSFLTVIHLLFIFNFRFMN